VGQIEMSMDKPGQIIGQSETSHGQKQDKVGQNMDKNGTFTVSWQDENGNFVF
jgi:hypothetical protein